MSYIGRGLAVDSEEAVLTLEQEQHIARRAAMSNGAPVPSDPAKLALEYHCARRAAMLELGGLAKFEKLPLALEFARTTSTTKLLAVPSKRILTLSTTRDDFKPLGLDRFQKTVLREGKWKHPTRDFVVDATPAYMREIVTNFGRLKGHVETYVPLGHSRDPNANTGFVEELTIGRGADGKAELVAVIDFRDPDVCERVRRGTIRGVSCGIDPDFRVSHGNGRVEKIGTHLEHVALTMAPVVGGLGEFVPIH